MIKQWVQGFLGKHSQINKRVCCIIIRIEVARKIQFLGGFSNSLLLWYMTDTAALDLTGACVVV